jgi:hypothetical protein
LTVGAVPCGTLAPMLRAPNFRTNPRVLLVVVRVLMLASTIGTDAVQGNDPNLRLGGLRRPAGYALGRAA